MPSFMANETHSRAEGDRLPREPGELCFLPGEWPAHRQGESVGAGGGQAQGDRR